MFSIQRYNVDMQKVGGPQGIFYTEDAARKAADTEDNEREASELLPLHYEIVPA